MKILAIETSCDETGVSLLNYDENTKEIEIHGNTLSSQIEIHEKYGGVFPALAKRAHAEKIIPLTMECLGQANLLKESPNEVVKDISFLDAKEPELKIALVEFVEKYEKPDIDYIAVTIGPGLEPALWVGINTARAFSILWDIPLIPVDHMEGHLLTPILHRLDDKKFIFENISFPTLSLLISGGHTELVVAEELGKYKKIGQTRDDAVGEAFDKVARMIGLPYPGGPAISKLAKEFRNKNIENKFTFPRPMIYSDDFDFSFSGIKTAVLYAIRDLGHEPTDEEKEMIACEFENAVTEVLIKKVLKAIEEYSTQSLIVGGGVASNTYIKEKMVEETISKYSDMEVYFPESKLATDNAVMIGIAGILKAQNGYKMPEGTVLKANGNLSITNLE